MDTTTKINDKFTISYSIFVGLLFLLFALSRDLDRIFNLWLALVPLLLLPTIVVVLVLIGCLIYHATNRRWRRVLSVVAAPVIAYLFFSLLGEFGINTDRIRFEFGKQYYLDQIARVPRTEEPRFKMFDWGSTGGAAVVNILYTLIYDESDEIGLSPEQRSTAWNQRANALCPGSHMCSILNPNPPRHIVHIKKMQGHFYLVTEFFQ